ncbi:hypothetical protein F5Y08DRAFT_211683 [Xylaria arbuscula]|nr:hypothetical protein F5Y08DRAFT_211683 [Xylaria arbuscula]
MNISCSYTNYPQTSRRSARRRLALQPPQPQPAAINPTIVQSQGNSGPPVIGTERPVVIPPRVDQNEVDYLGQGVGTIIRIAQFLRAPVVPSPALLLYNINGIEPFTDALLNAALDDPERAALELLQYPRPDHPYPNNEPALRTVPESTLIDDSQPNGRCLEQVQGNVCNRPTLSVCEDTIHGTNCEFPICPPCHNDARARFRPAMAAIVKTLRAYACGPCSAQAQDPTNFEEKD